MSERHFETMSSFIPDFDRVKTAYVADAIDETKYAVAEEDMPLPEEAGAEFDRFIAKIKADALREAAIQVVTQVENVEADEAWDAGPYYHGARYGMRKTAHWLHRSADRIEGASNE